MTSAPVDNLDLLQHLLESGSTVQDLDLNVPGLGDYVFHYQPLGYLAKSRCVSAATEYMPELNNAGAVIGIKSVFRLDIYKKLAIKEMFGDKGLKNPVPITDQLLEKLSEDIGSQFDAVIPDPFGSPSKLAAVKKEPESSSEVSDAPRSRRTRT